MPLPHFTTIQSHSENWEPVYKSLFEITFDLPPILGRTTQDGILMLENATSVSLPLTPDIETKEQRFKYSTRAFVTLPSKTTFEFDIKFNMNENDKSAVYTWNVLKAWYDLVWNSQTGEAHTKREIVGNIIVNVHNKKGKIIRRVTYRNAQILGVSDWELDWESPTEILDATAKFISDYPEDVYIDQ